MIWYREWKVFSATIKKHQTNLVNPMTFLQFTQISILQKNMVNNLSCFTLLFTSQINYTFNLSDVTGDFTYINTIKRSCNSKKYVEMSEIHWQIILTTAAFITKLLQSTAGPTCRNIYQFRFCWSSNLDSQNTSYWVKMLQVQFVKHWGIDI